MSILKDLKAWMHFSDSRASHPWVTLRLTYLSRIDKLISQALSDGLDVSEGSFSGTSAQQPDSLRDSSKVHT